MTDLLFNPDQQKELLTAVMPLLTLVTFDDGYAQVTVGLTSNKDVVESLWSVGFSSFRNEPIFKKLLGFGIPVRYNNPVICYSTDPRFAELIKKHLFDNPIKMKCVVHIIYLGKTDNQLAALAVPQVFNNETMSFEPETNLSNPII